MTNRQLAQALLISPIIGSITGTLIVALYIYIYESGDVIPYIIISIPIVIIFAYMGIMLALPVNIILNQLKLKSWCWYVLAGGGLANLIIHDAQIWKWSMTVGMVTAYIFWFIAIRNNVVIPNIDETE